MQAMLAHAEELRQTLTETIERDAAAFEAVMKAFKLPKFKSPDALEDALQTAYLFLYLLKKFHQGGIATLKDLYQAGRGGKL